MAGCEVVAAVDDHVRRRDQPRQQRLVGAQGVSLDGDAGVDLAHGLRSRFDLQAAHASLGVSDLALEVGEVDLVVVHQRDMPDAGGREIQRHGRAQAARADDQHAAGADARLPVDSEFL
ncbi:hypothetical protein QFZ42_000542 [Variovorax paradoxus]|nr:hypothetical protein [Variovorax paradoxus]